MEFRQQVRSRVIDAEELDDWMTLHPNITIRQVLYVGDGNVLVLYVDETQ